MTSYTVEPAAVHRLPAALHALRPEAAARFEQLAESVWAAYDPAVLELVRLRIAWLLGNTVGLTERAAPARAAGLGEDRIAALPSYPRSPAFSTLEREALAFAEQLVMDVSATSPESRDALAAEVGAQGLRPFVTALWVIEYTQRLQVVATALLPTAPARRALAVDAAGTLREELDAYQAAVMRGDALDPALTEMVRLRCARTHRCRICQTLRLADARAVGVDDAMTAKIDRYRTSDLPERVRLALQITDALIVAPGDLDGPTVERARELFTPEQLAELCLDITKWSTQKIHVALDLDGADTLDTDADGIALFGFRDDGAVAGYWT